MHYFSNLFDKIWGIVHLVGFHYKNISRCTVLWMSKKLQNALFFISVFRNFKKEYKKRFILKRNNLEHYYYTVREFISE
jgi:hypothetical protein